MLDLSLEELEDVLVQVTDHSIPYSKKGPLIRRLNEEASKDESSLESCAPSSLPSSFIPKFLLSSSASSSFTPSSRVSDNIRKFKNLNSNNIFFKEVDYFDDKVSTSQSLQDLATFCKNAFGEDTSESMKSFGNQSNKSRTATRANSLTISQIVATQTKKVDTDLNDPNKRCSASSKFTNSVKNNRNRTNKMKQAKSNSFFDGQLVSTNSACDFDSGINESNSSQRLSKNYKELKQANSLGESEKCDCDLNPNMNVSNVKVSKDTGLSGQSNIEYSPIEMEELGKKIELTQFSANRKPCSNSKTTASGVLEENNNLQSNRTVNYKNVDTFVNISALSKTGPIAASIAERIINHSSSEHTNEETMLQNVVLTDENKTVQATIGKAYYLILSCQFIFIIKTILFNCFFVCR